MIGILGIVAALTVLAVSLIVTRLATVALTLTGLSEEAARFQARSAFTGTGFTTSEAEAVVHHPVRRRIIMLLMILRSAGLVSIVISLIFSFGTMASSGEHLLRLLFLILGVIVLVLLAKTGFVNRTLSRVMRWALERWTDLDARDYASLLRLSQEYTVMEIRIQEGDWVAGRTLQDCALAGEGVNVLGIQREDGSYVGAPNGKTEIYPEDSLILYGHAENLAELDRRHADLEGDQAHQRAVDQQIRRVAEQKQREEEHKKKRKSELGEQ